MCNSREPGLAAEGAYIICDLGSVKLALVVEDHALGNADTSDDALPDEFFDFSCGYGGNNLSFYPLREIVHHNKKVITVSCGFGERPQYVHAPSSKW